jgi:hypothetical protein
MQNNFRNNVTHLPLSTGHGDVDESAGISYPLLGASLGGLLLLLGLNLCSRPLAVSATRRIASAAGQRAQHFYLSGSYLQLLLPPHRCPFENRLCVPLVSET